MSSVLSTTGIFANLYNKGQLLLQLDSRSYIQPSHTLDSVLSNKSHTLDSVLSNKSRTLDSVFSNKSRTLDSVFSN